MIRRLLFFLFLPLIHLSSIAQESQLNLLAEKRKAVLEATEDERRVDLNTNFRNALRDFIDTYGYDAIIQDSLKKVGFIESDNGKLKIINWNLPFNNGSFTYDAILFHGKRSPDIFYLTDGSEGMRSPEYKICDKNNWFGALYFSIVKGKNKALGNYYLLLGWDGHTIESNKKVIEVLTFNEKTKEPVFGGLVFGKPYEQHMRFLMEYTNDAIASLRYHPKDNRIVFNELIPPRPEMEGLTMYYVPSLSFNAFEEDGDRWVFLEDVEVRMNKSNASEYLDPTRKKSKRQQRSIPNQR